MEKIAIEKEKKNIYDLINNVFENVEQNQMENLFERIFNFIEEKYGSFYTQPTIVFSQKQNKILDQLKNQIKDIFEDKQYMYAFLISITMNDIHNKNVGFDKVYNDVKRFLGSDLDILNKLKLKQDIKDFNFKGYRYKSAHHWIIDEALTLKNINYVIEEKNKKLKEHVLEQFVTHILEVIYNNNSYIIDTQLSAYMETIKRDGEGVVIEEDPSLLKHKIFEIIEKHPLYNFKENNQEDYNNLIKNYGVKNSKKLRV